MYFLIKYEGLLLIVRLKKYIEIELKLKASVRNALCRHPLEYAYAQCEYWHCMQHKDLMLRRQTGGQTVLDAITRVGGHWEGWYESGSWCWGVCCPPFHFLGQIQILVISPYWKLKQSKSGAISYQWQGGRVSYPFPSTKALGQMGNAGYSGLSSIPEVPESHVVGPHI